MAGSRYRSHHALPRAVKPFLSKGILHVVWRSVDRLDQHLHPTTLCFPYLLLWTVLDYRPILLLFYRSCLLGLADTPDPHFDIGACPTHSLVVILLWLILLRVEELLPLWQLLIIVWKELVYGAQVWAVLIDWLILILHIDSLYVQVPPLFKGLMFVYRRNRGGHVHQSLVRRIRKFYLLAFWALVRWIWSDELPLDSWFIQL